MPEISQLIIGQPQAYLTDPHLWVDSRATLSIRFSLYESLVKYNRQGKIVPGLATNWSLAEDARSWTFQIRPGVRFHDGSLLTTNDVVASLRRAASADMPGEYGTAALLALYLGKAIITVGEGETVQVVTPEPMADLLDLLLYAVIVPERSLAHNDADVTRVPGTGPYCLESARQDEVVLIHNPDYWAGTAPVKRLVFRGIHGDEARVQAFLSGEADLITYVPARLRGSFQVHERARVIEGPSSLCVIVMFNSFTGPCTDRRVRQALNYATDVDALITQLYGGNAERLNGPLSRLHCGTDPELSPYRYDVHEARRLLAEAGYADGLRMTLNRPVISPDESPELAAMLREQWKAAGVELDECVEENREQYALNVRAKKISDLCVFDSSPMSTYRIFREKLDSRFAGPWWEGYHNEQVNTLTSQAWSTVDETQRVEIYRQAYRLIQSDAPWLFLYNPINLWVADRHIQEALPDWSAGIDGLVLFGQG